MSTTRYTDLFNEVLPEMPGCSTALAENAIRNAVIAFCRDSWVWKHNPDKQAIVSGTAEYSLESPAGSDVAEIMLLTQEGVQLQPLSAEKADAGEAGYVLSEDRTTVTLYPTPAVNVTNGLSFTLAVAPRRASTTFPSWIFSRYLDSLAVGAKARLMRMPAKPWTNMEAGDAYLKEFRAGATAAKAEAVRNLPWAPTLAAATLRYVDLFNDVLPEVPDCPTALAENAIRNAVIAFCRDSLVWQHTPVKQAIVADQATYVVAAPAGADLVELTRLTLGGEDVDPITREEALYDEAEGYTLSEDGTSIVLYPTPAEAVVQAEGLGFTFAVAPKRTSTTFPSWIHTRYLEALALGAKANLLRIPKKPWTDMKSGDAYLSEFRAKTASAREDAVRNLTRTTVRTASYH